MPFLGLGSISSAVSYRQMETIKPVQVVPSDSEDEVDLVEDQFPLAKFRASLHPDCLDATLSTEQTIVIVCTHTCYCWEDQPRSSDYILVRCRAGSSSITYRDAVNAMVEADYDPDCNHVFLENFYRENESSIQFQAYFGS